jgi:hypothetical protein
MQVTEKIELFHVKFPRNRIGEPVVVGVTMYVLSISSLSEVQMVPYTNTIQSNISCCKTYWRILLLFRLSRIQVVKHDQIGAVQIVCPQRF